MSVTEQDVQDAVKQLQTLSSKDHSLAHWVEKLPSMSDDIIAHASWTDEQKAQAISALAQALEAAMHRVEEDKKQAQDALRQINKGQRGVKAYQKDLSR